LGGGPIIVTAVDFGKGEGAVVRCPKCLHFVPLQEQWLGQVVTCPRAGCQGRMRLNPFVAGRLDGS
jgi:hypothetical protein